VAEPALLPGTQHFIVIEDPAYAPSGKGEHLYVEIEKEGLTTDQVAEALARACGKSHRDIGYAGRKDRWGVTRQWFSVHFGEEPRLAALGEHVRNGRATVLTVSRHANKLRLGHLAGNRFRLGVGGVADDAALAAACTRIAHDGIRNGFGAQRFGVAGATLALARAWGRGDERAAVELIVDPTGGWHWGDALPDGFRPGPEGRAFGALRRGADPRGALAAAGDQLRKLAASAAQSAVFNAVLAGREAAGLLRRLRVGDIGVNRKGAAFQVATGEEDDATARAAAGRLEVSASAPLPGDSRLRPAPEIDAEERAWAASTEVDWSWFQRGAPLESPGDRRALVVPFRTPPKLERGGEVLWIEFGLPSGVYATEVLAQAGVSVPADRRGAEPAPDPAR
jgi:tRNA pseudouridine13 synthase